ncbi:Hsp20/alpha crystallin family protein [Verrucomicrobiaceae bacterium 227]
MNSELTIERPRFKTRSADAGLELSIALPGVPKDSLQVNIENRLLTITGERSSLDGFESPDREARKYELKVELHEDLDPNVINANYQDGVLNLKLNKRQELAPRKIDILAN